MSPSQTRPVRHGILLVVGGAIGAGMFALPMVSAGAWLWWSVLGMLIVCIMTYLAAITVAKTHWKLLASDTHNVDYSSNFNALVVATIGPRWATINNLSIGFIMMILMYAYITAGGNILVNSLQTLAPDFSPDVRPWLSLSFAALIGIVVWLGVSVVSRLLFILLITMTITFVFATGSLHQQFDPSQLLNTNGDAAYLLAALPVFVTAFACGGLVPSLVQHYASEPHKVKQSLMWGAGITLAIYVYWLAISLGVIPRSQFVAIVNSGSALSNLVDAMTLNGAATNIQSRLNLFSHLAIVTSFLSVGVGLLHFIQDKFGLQHSTQQRGVAALICFLPPALASFFIPYGFVHAISYAGLFVAFSFFILPGLIGTRVLATEKLNVRAPAVACIIFGLTIAALKMCLVFELLPTFT